MTRHPKLTRETVDEAIGLKADGLSNGDIVYALGIHESTFYRWIGYAMMDDVLRGLVLLVSTLHCFDCFRSRS